MTTIASIFLMMPQSGEEQNPWSSFIFLGLIIVVFYLFFIRPQMKKSKDERKFRESLKKGDKVVTIGGIHGKIAEIKDTTIILETEGQGRLKVERSAVSMGGVDTQMNQKK